ncbi:MAG: hypothetical protein KKA79_09020 [Nanoarchaeota archaeon]|nr:hypothetical protein [Nanoarchaeota archaeon]
MTDLFARLNTEASFNKSTAEEKKYGAGIYVSFREDSDTYKEGSFKKVIDSMVEQALESGEDSYKNIAEVVQNYFDEQSAGKVVEVMVYDPKTNEFLRNASNEESPFMSLGDAVSDYIVEREFEEEMTDYLDIIVRQRSKVGGK